MVYILNKILLVSAALLTFVACSKDSNSNSGKPSGAEVSVVLPIAVADVEQTAGVDFTTKAEGGPQEGFSVIFGDHLPAGRSAHPASRSVVSTLTNVWLLQFDKAGKNLKTINIGTINSGDMISAELVTVVEGTIYIIANGVASGLSSANPATLYDFENTMLYVTATSSSDDIPIVGKLSNVSVIDLGDGTGRLKLSTEEHAVMILKRIQAEVTVNVDFDVLGYTMTGVQLFNVPNGAAYGWSSATTTFPSEQASNFNNTTKSAGLSPVSIATSNSVNTYKWFIGDNRRGDVMTIYDHSSRSAAKAPKYSTFARITLNGSNAESLYYDIYLGSGSRTNFDVLRNNNYTFTVTLKGLPEFHESLIGVDGRVSGDGFPVYLTDKKADSPFIVSQVVNEMVGVSLTDAQTRCAALLPVGKWRLPNLQELMMMWVYKESTSSAERPQGMVYWSSTADLPSATNNWGVSAVSGLTDNYAGASIHSARCVIDNWQLRDWAYPRLDADRIIVSRDEDGGMDETSMLTSVQKSFILNQSVMYEYSEISEYNKPSAKFQIAAANCLPDLSYDYSTAYAACKAYSEAGAAAGSWRVPSQRELMLIWVMNNKLAAGALTGSYLSTTYDSRYPVSQGWVANFDTGAISSAVVTTQVQLRCVRDL